MIERIGSAEIIADQSAYAPEQIPVEQDLDYSAPYRMPTDELTGLPYPILPIRARNVQPSKRKNYHHHFYNRRDPHLEGDLAISGRLHGGPEHLTLEELAGVAVRMSRGQLLPSRIHKDAHDKYPVGPILPRTIDDKFITAVKACSGVVSRYGIDLSRPADQRLVYMNDKFFQSVANPNHLCTERKYYSRPADYRRRVLGNFFMRYALTKDLSHISEKTIDMFLSPRDEQMRREIGNFILFRAYESALEPVAPIYNELKQQGMVQPGRRDLVPSMKKLIHPHLVEQMHPLIEQRFAA